MFVCDCVFVECCLSQFSSKQEHVRSDCAGSDDDSIALAFRYLRFLSASQILFASNCVAPLMMRPLCDPVQPVIRTQLEY